MAQKTALITGVTGQDGSYLAELLLDKGYHVHGLVRRNSDFTSKRIDRILFHERFKTHYGDVVDTSSLHSMLARTQPTEERDAALWNSARARASAMVSLEAGTVNVLVSSCTGMPRYFA